MNVGQPVIMQAANSEAQEPTEDVMDDADVAETISAVPTMQRFQVLHHAEPVRHQLMS